MQQYQLSALAVSGKEEGAVLCRFSHGPPEQLLDPSAFSSISFQLHHNRDVKSRTTASQRTLAASTPRVDYVGRNFGDQSAKLNQYTYALGLVDERQHSIQMLPVSHVYSMAQHVKVRAPRVSGAAAAETEGEQSYAMRQKALIDSFGSKKRKSQLASKESNRVIVQQQTAAVLDAALQQNQPQRSMDEEEMSEAAIMRQTKLTVLPPFDEATDEPMRIYQLDRFIPKHVQQLLQAEVKRYAKIAKDEALLEQLAAALAAERKRNNSAGQLEAKDVKAEDKVKKEEKAAVNTLEAHELTPFVLHRLQQLTFLDAPLVHKSCLLLVYYHLLLTLKLANPRQPRRALSALAHRLPDGVLSHLLDTFAVSTPADTADGQASYAVDSVGKQRVLCYVLVATLLMGGGKVSGGELELVAEECTMGVVEVIGIYREVGAAKASRAGAELVAPLVLGRFKRRAKKARQ